MLLFSVVFLSWKKNQGNGEILVGHALLDSFKCHSGDMIDVEQCFSVCCQQFLDSFVSRGGWSLSCVKKLERYMILRIEAVHQSSCFLLVEEEDLHSLASLLKGQKTGCSIICQGYDCGSGTFEFKVISFL